MKKILYYSDLIFLRIIPLVYFVFSLYSDIYVSFQLWNKAIGVLDVMTDSYFFSFCFLFLGCASVLGKFASTVKVANICKYVASGVASVYILGYGIKMIWSLSWGVFPAFFRSVIELQDEVLVIAFVMLIVCCYLKDDFYKLKWGFTISCVILFFIASALPVVSLMAYNDPLAWRLMLNSLISVCCCGAVVLLSLRPKKPVSVQEEEQPFQDPEKYWEEEWVRVLRQGDDPSKALELSLRVLEVHPCNSTFLYRAAISEERLAEMEEDEAQKQNRLRWALRYANRLDDVDDEMAKTLLVRIHSKMDS